jgi:hypothetical protein
MSQTATGPAVAVPGSAPPGARYGDPAWWAQRKEEILEPALEIVDPHHHLWVRNGHRYLIDELLADTGSGHNITQTVFVECGSMYRADAPAEMKPVGEIEFVNGTSAMSASGQFWKSRLCAGIVGHADLRLGDGVARVLEAEIAAGDGRFRSIRHSVVWDASEMFSRGRTNSPKGQMADATWRAGFARLAPLNLTFEAWLYHPQLMELADLGRRLRRVLVRFASDSPLEASGARGLTSQTILPHSWPLHSKTCTATRLARSHIPSGTSDDAGRICKTISKRAAYITRTDSCTVERSLTSSTAGLPRAVAFRATRRKSRQTVPHERREIYDRGASI